MTTFVSARPDVQPLVVPFGEGDRSMADLLGGKGANLAEMTRLGLPVPHGFVITTQACRDYLRLGHPPVQLEPQLVEQIAVLERVAGRRLGDPTDPLLVSVRSGARSSMPGMMETVLNVGMTDAVVEALATRRGPRFAWDCYRRLVQMYGRTVLGVDEGRFEERLARARQTSGVADDTGLDAQTLRGVTHDFRRILREESGEDLPQDPQEQVRRAVVAVFDSWNGERARRYRAHEGIPDDLGTAVSVVEMVYGNAGARSGSGVCFTRDPAGGAPGVYGDYLANAQGEDVVNGSRATLALSGLADLEPECYQGLLQHVRTLENHYGDMCDVEFTIEEGHLWILQTRVGKRSAAAAFRIACDLVDEGRIDMDEALRRVTGPQLQSLLHPRFRAATDDDVIATGLPASPGAAVGEAVFDSETAVSWGAAGRAVVLVRPETSADDVGGMLASVAVVTARGGLTSHAAVVARGVGRTCVTGVEGLEVDVEHGRARCPGGFLLVQGDIISVDGSSGLIHRGRLEVQPSQVAEAVGHAGDPGHIEHSADPLVSAVLRVLAHADQRRTLGVRANAETGPDAVSARGHGAEGIGLCRTEHMLLGPRRVLVERLLTSADRGPTLEAIEKITCDELTAVMAAMDGLPVVVRLLDPPLHEFLPDLVELSVQVAVDEVAGHVDPELVEQLAAVRRWHETNPMLGLRGVRLLSVLPEIIDAQVRGLCEAIVALRARGLTPVAEVMVPLVADVAELEAAKARIVATVSSVAAARGVDLDLPVGVMIELPRAALTAGALARAATFFSFGTNDLTQTTWGISRDDAEGSFLTEYRSSGLVRDDPFETLDQVGVGRLVQCAIEEGRAARPALGLGACGEHAGDPASVRYFADCGVDYVSCSPPRVPVARLEAGRAAVLPAGAAAPGGGRSAPVGVPTHG